MFGGQGAVIIFCFRNLARKVCVSWALSLVECVAVWVLMLTHIQAPHTDALKTHFTQNISAALLECEKSIRKQRENVDKSPDVGAFQDSRFFNKGKGIPSYGVALGCVVEPISVLSIAAIQQKHFVTSGL